MERFINLLHCANATVLTYNYDTLIEKAVNLIRPLDLSNAEDRVSYLDVVGFLPKIVGANYTNLHHTFKLLKLHGSTDCWWFPGDSTGSTIVRLYYSEEPNRVYENASSLDNLFALKSGSSPPDGMSPLNEDQIRNKFVPGLSRFIVPPTLGKNAFYSNPVMYELWKQARSAIANASEIHLVGYSLPTADIASIGMLGELAKNSAKVYIANIDPHSVKTVVKENKIKDRIAEIFSFESINCWMDDFESRLATEAVNKLRRILEDISSHGIPMEKYGVALNCNPEGAVTVSNIRREGSKLCLELAPNCDPLDLVTLSIHGGNRETNSHLIKTQPYKIMKLNDLIEGVNQIVVKHKSRQYTIVDANLTNQLHPGAFLPFWLVLTSSTSLFNPMN